MSELGEKDQKCLGRLFNPAYPSEQGPDAEQSVEIVSRALLNDGSEAAEAARSALAKVVDLRRSQMWWWLAGDSSDEVVARTFELFAFPHEGFTAQLIAYCTRSGAGAGGAGRFAFMARKLEAEGAARRCATTASFSEHKYGLGYDEKAPAVWALLNVLATGEPETFASCAKGLFADMSQADIAMDILCALQPDEEEGLSNGDECWQGVRVGQLVAVRTWKTSKKKNKGRLSVKGHRTPEKASKDLAAKVKKARTKLGL